MAVLSGTAKLSNGDPATQIVAVHPLRGHVRTAVPALDGSYSIPGVPKGKWLVTAEGPAGYRPLTHVLDVERVPEAESVYEKVWEAWSYDGSTTGEKIGIGLHPASTNPGVFVAGRNGLAGGAISVASGSHDYARGVEITGAFGLGMWFKRTNMSVGQFLPSLGWRSNDSNGTNPGYLLTDGWMDVSRTVLNVRGRMHPDNDAGAWLPLAEDVELGAWHHIVQIIDPKGLTVWLDGKRYFFAKPSPQRLHFVSLRFSRTAGTVIDDLLQFNKMPSDDEIEYLYNFGAGPSWAELKADAGFA